MDTCPGASPVSVGWSHDGRTRREHARAPRAGRTLLLLRVLPAPRTRPARRQLWQAITELEPYGPTFVSVTYGAGGTTRDRTVAITERIARETGMLPVAHLTCVGHTVAELDAILDELAEAGVHHVMALRGDPSAGPGTRGRRPRAA